MSLFDLSSIQLTPLSIFLATAALGGWIMMNAFLGRRYVKGKKLDDWEKRAIAAGIGLLFEGTLFLPPLILVNFWLGLPVNILYVASAFFLSVSFGVIFQFKYGEKKDKTKQGFQKGAKSILTFSVFCYSLTLVFVSSVGLGAFLYSKFTFLMISNVWGTFTILAIILYFIFCSGVLFTWLFVLNVSSFNQWRINARQVIRKRGFLFICLFILTVFMAGFLIPPIDAQFALLTPKVIEEKPAYSPQMTSISLFINSSRQINEVISNFSSFVLMERDYKVQIPVSRSLESIIIKNPSNVGCKIGDKNNYSVMPESTIDIEEIAINIPSGVSYKALLKDPKDPSSEVWALLISFDGFSGNSFWANITYWQEVDLTKNLHIPTYQIGIEDLGNGTWMETHTLAINNENNESLWIPYLYCDWFSMNYVQTNTTVVYLNGHIQPANEIINLHQLYVNNFVSSLRVTNLTFTFLDNQNPIW